MGSTRKFPLLVSALALAGSLHLAHSQRARACSPLPAVLLHTVSSANVAGPIVFLTSCGQGTIACSELGKLRVVRLGSLQSVAGKIETRAADQLVLFTPESPLDAAGNYNVLLGDSATPVGNFSFLAPSATAPLDRARATQSTRSEGVGRGYQCDFAYVPSGECNPKRGLGWDERQRVYATLSVTVPSTDGFLFRAAQQGGPSSSGSWQTSLELSTDLSEGVESCFVVDAWDVLRDAHEARSFCKLGPSLSEAEQNRPTTTPDLGACTALPRHADDQSEASELLATWCRDRRAYCAKPAPFVGQCAVTDSRCPQPASNEQSDRDERGSSAATDASTPAEAGADQARAMNPDQSEQAEAGCSLARSNSSADRFFWLLLLLALRTSRGRHLCALLRRRLKCTGVMPR